MVAGENNEVVVKISFLKFLSIIRATKRNFVITIYYENKGMLLDAVISEQEAGRQKRGKKSWEQIVHIR